MTPEPSEREQQIEQADIITRVANGSLLLKLNDPEGTRSALLAGASALRSSAGLAWQPIETAPKDVEVLVFDEGVITISLWIDEDGEGDDGRLKGWWEQSSNSLIDPPPTHWMPLPDPPVALLASAQDGEK